MSATEDYTIEFSNPYDISSSSISELSINQIGKYYGYQDPNDDPNGELLKLTSIVITSLQTISTGGAPSFGGDWYYVVDDTAGRIATQITTLPFRLSDLSNCSLRFVPTTNEDGYAKFTFLFYSSILVQPSFTVDTNTFSSNTAYTSDYCAVQWNYRHRNYAPIINQVNIDLSSTSLEKIKTDVSGVTIASIIGNNSVNYRENNSLDTQGIVITGTRYEDSSKNEVSSVGFWQYKKSTDTIWTDILFSSQDTRQYFFKLSSGFSVRFYPVDNKSVNAILFFKAWDSSLGTEGRQSPLSSDGTNPTSAATATITVPVEKVNYAPILKNTTYTVPGILEDITDVSNNGVVLDNLFFDINGGIGLDPSTDPGRGIVITGITDNNLGRWQFYNGSVWTDISKSAITANPSRPLHLLESKNGLTPAIRFRPSKDMNGRATFSYNAWSGLNGLDNYSYATVDSSPSYSAESGTATITITPVEDSPDFSGNKLGILVRSYNQGYIPGNDEITNGIDVSNTILSRFTITDVDSSANEFSIVITGVSIISDVVGQSYSPSDFSIGFPASSIQWESSSINLSLLNGTNAIYLNRGTSFRILGPSTFVGKVDFTFYLWHEAKISNIIVNTRQLVSFTYSSLTNKEFYSLSTASFRVLYADINDPPVLVRPTTLNINSLKNAVQNEDSNIVITPTITEIMGQLTITDADAATNVSIPVHGLAFYGTTVYAPDFSGKSITNYGSWYIEMANGSRVQLTGLDISNAYHVRPDSGVKLLYVPAPNIYGLFKIYAYVWDRSNEADVPAFTYEPASNTTEISPYSVNSLEIQLTVSPANDAPVVNPIIRPSAPSYLPFIRLPNIIRGTMNNMGSKLVDLISQISPYVIDGDPLDTFGIVLLTINTSWQYSIRDINGIPQWIPLTTKNVHLMPLDNSSTGQITRIRYTQFNIPITNSIAFYVWDMTNNIVNGNTTPFINNNTRSYSDTNQSLKISVTVSKG